MLLGILLLIPVWLWAAAARGLTPGGLPGEKTVMPDTDPGRLETGQHGNELIAREKLWKVPRKYVATLKNAIVVEAGEYIKVLYITATRKGKNEYRKNMLWVALSYARVSLMLTYQIVRGDGTTLKVLRESSTDETFSGLSYIPWRDKDECALLFVHKGRPLFKLRLLDPHWKKVEL